MNNKIKVSGKHKLLTFPLKGHLHVCNRKPNAVIVLAQTSSIGNACTGITCEK